MEKTSTLNLRVNPVLKHNVETVLGRLGIPVSTAVDDLESDCTGRRDTI